MFSTFQFLFFTLYKFLDKTKKFDKTIDRVLNDSATIDEPVQFKKPIIKINIKSPLFYHEKKLERKKIYCLFNFDCYQPHNLFNFFFLLEIQKIILKPETSVLMEDVSVSSAINQFNSTLGNFISFYFLNGYISIKFIF